MSSDRDPSTTGRQGHDFPQYDCGHAKIPGIDSCPKCPPKPTAVSLSSELSVLNLAVQGAKILVDTARNGDAPTPEVAIVAPQACSAVLALISCRMNMVVGAITDNAQASRVVADHNQVATQLSGVTDGDILLPLDATDDADGPADD